MSKLIHCLGALYAQQPCQTCYIQLSASNEATTPLSTTVFVVVVIVIVVAVINVVVDVVIIVVDDVLVVYCHVLF